MSRRPDRRQVLASAAALAGVAACGRGPAPKAAPALNAEGTATMKRMLDDHVAKGAAPGVVALVRRGEATEVHTAGTLALGGGGPVQRDTIFRIASMTKPVTAAVAMMLVEEGKLKLDEPIDRLAPELANRRVLKREDGPLDDTVPAKRPITVEDLLTFRMGWGIVFEPTPFSKAAAGIPGFGPPIPTSPLPPDAWMRRIGALPLIAQPGERWLYTTASDVLGVLIARAERKPLPQVFQARILGPLGMKDTGFHAPAEKLGRFATAYANRDGELALFDPPDGMYAKPPVFPEGDSGLVSTVDDFAAFARFLRTGLAADGRSLLGDASRKAMTTNHLTPEQRAGGRFILAPGRGWGYGMAVVVEPNADGVAPGAYGWNGGFGTSWFDDPAKDLTAILLTQRVFDGPDPPQIHKDFWRAAYGAAA